MKPASMAKLLAEGAVTIAVPPPAPVRAPAKRAAPGRAPKSREVILAKQRRELARLDALHSTLAEKAASLIEDVSTLKDISEAAGALDRLGRITDRLIALERQAHGLDRPASAHESEFATLLKKAWERAYGTPPPDLV